MGDMGAGVLFVVVISQVHGHIRTRPEGPNPVLDWEVVNDLQNRKIILKGIYRTIGTKRCTGIHLGTQRCTCIHLGTHGYIYT